MHSTIYDDDVIKRKFEFSIEVFLEDGGVLMTIDTNTMVSITEANQNFSKVAKLVDDSAVAKDEEVLEISKRLLAQNKEAYEVLAE